MSVTQGTWNTGEQIRDHKLVCSIINLYGTEDEVFDVESQSELEQFTLARSVANRDQYLNKKGYVDDANTPHGEKAANHGDLTGFLIARYETDDPAFDERDWQMLEDWFKRGTPKGESVRR